jgi:hypothetical protein
MAVSHTTPIQILGAVDAPFNILVIGDGFGSDATAFNTVCVQLSTAIRACNWWTATGKKLGLWRMRVRPAAGDPVITNLLTGGPMPNAPKVALQIKYGGEGIERLMEGYDGDVQDLKIELDDPAGPFRAARPTFRGFGSVAILVNYPVYGGSGRTYAWFSKTPGQFPAVFLHELGHTMLLKDEYEVACGKSRLGTGTIREYNITSEELTPQWATSIDIGPPHVVAKPYGHKTDCEAPYTGAATDVGAFEGALYKHTGYYRPSHDCLMRHNVAGNTFCKICDSIIANRLDPWQPNLVGG